MMISRCVFCTIHDGSAPDLTGVVAHYEQLFGFTLSSQQRSDLIEFLKSL
jgi:hypothetical protein